MVRLSQHDLRNALEFVHEASSVDTAEPFPQPLLDLLGRLVPAEFISYSEWDITKEPVATLEVEQPVVSMPPDVVDARREYCCSFPLSVVTRGSERRPLKISDFMSLRELHRLDYYDCVLRPYRIEHQLRLWLSAPDGASRFFAFSRPGEGHDFGERERGVLELLRPFLVAIRERFELRRAETPSNGSALTEREAEILHWVARGKTNREIASLLFVSPHTVRKHLENVYEKLGVHTRTAAVRAAGPPAADRRESRRPAAAGRSPSR
jgi:DNA-binding CsgD family transcriptional regulator